MLACNQRNLGRRASGEALRGGVLMAGVSLGTVLLANEFGLGRRIGWVVALPLAASCYLVISGIFGICIVHGLRGDRSADHGCESVLDRVNRAQMRNRALLAVSASLLIAFGFAAAFVARS